MTRKRFAVLSTLCGVPIALALAFPGTLCAGQHSKGFRIETPQAAAGAIPKDFYLEGNAIPVEKLNSDLAITPEGKQMIFGLLDTSGYSSQVQEKYAGMLITEGGLELCGRRVGTGSYGFGLKSPAPPSKANGYFTLYNQAGTRVAGCVAKQDLKLRAPRPLQIVPGAGDAARLYLGRYWVEIRTSR